MNPKYQYALAAVLLSLCAAGAEAQTRSEILPKELAGTWMQPSKNESGAMRVYVTEYKEKEIFGILEIRDTPDCREPVAFRGIIDSEKGRVLIQSTETVVCGYGGFLVGEVRRGGIGTFIGNYEYRYPIFKTKTLTFASGTFVLEPVPQK